MGVDFCVLLFLLREWLEENAAFEKERDGRKEKKQLLFGGVFWYWGALAAWQG